MAAFVITKRSFTTATARLPSMDDSDAGRAHGKRSSSESPTDQRRGRSRGQLGRIPADPAGTLIIIGGHENKEGHRPILEAIAKRVGDGKLIVATLASEEPDPQWETYNKAFRELGVERIEHLDARERHDLMTEDLVELLEGASVVFFAGGDQLKITSKFGGTVLCERMRELYEQGGTIAGT